MTEKKSKQTADLPLEIEEQLQAAPPHLRGSLKSLYHGIKAREAEEAAQSKQQKPVPVMRPVQLPLWPEPVRGTPNSFLRSALFPAIQGKTRRWMKKELLASQKGASVRFTGQQLDQADLDVWQQAVEIAHFHKLGNVCQFRANAFLKAIGRSNGKANYEWLNDSINRLIACAVEIKVENRIFTGSLISSCIRDEQTGAYQLRFDQDTLKLFSGNDWTGIEWEQRQALKGKPLALWLHGFYSSHAQPYPLKVETLMELSGSTTKAIRNFKIALKKAFANIEAVGGIKATIDGDLVAVDKTPTAAQARHLLKKAILRRKKTV